MDHKEDMDGELDKKLPELKIDAKQAQGFIKYFNTLPQDPRTVRFFNRKEYYSSHGENAVFIAKTYYHTMSVVRALGSNPGTLPTVTISHRLFENILRDLLLEKGDHIVEVYEGSGSSFQLAKAASPGNLSAFEDVLFSTNEMQDTPMLASVFVTAGRDGECVVGLAFVDLANRSLGMTQFLDDDHFASLESSLLGLGCRECLVPPLDSNPCLRDTLARCGCLATEQKRTNFRSSSADVACDVARLLRDASWQCDAEEAAAAAMAALLKYTELLSDDSNYGSYRVESYSPGTHMRLDAAALRAMNVLESKTDGNRNFSLVGLMNRTCTAGMGKRLLSRWVKQPLVDVELIRRRHDAVEAFVDSVEMRSDIRQHLKRVPDVERIVRRVERRKANLKDVVKLYQASIRLPLIRNILRGYQGEFQKHLWETYLAPLEEWTGAEHLGKYDGLVEAAIDLEKLEEGEYMIAAGYDPSLQQLKSDRDSVEAEIQAAFHSCAADLALVAEKSLKMDRSAQHGFVFRISKKEETAVRKKLSGGVYATIETRKDGVKFTNSRLRRLSEQHSGLTEEYSAAQRQLVAKVVDVAATFAEVFERVAALLAELDVLLSFADLAVSAPTPYVRPAMTDSNEGDIVLEGSRHPCVEVQDDVSFIPNDCRMVRDKSWFQIITGPNMGGKSTFIRQVGVNVLMAQVGCFVPCDRAEISVRDCIFARVGAGDCQLRGVSTFMAEMLETASILKAATHKSLIIIDELGRGTSTYDGFGLAWAICEHLVQVTKAPTLFATHFHELTSLASSATAVANYHVSAHIDAASRKLTMLYRLEEGPCDQSFGIHVAEFAHFPASVVELARKKAEELEDFAPDQSLNDVELGRKRKRVVGPDDAVTGAARARQFLRDFAAVPMDRLAPAEMMRRVEELKSALEDDAVSNPWLQDVIGLRV